MGNLASTVIDSFKGIPDYYRWAFRGEAAKNYGEMIGHSAAAGLGIGSLIAGTLIGGPLGFAAALPGAIAGVIPIAGNIKDLINNKDLNTNINKTADDVMSSDAGRVLQALAGVSDFISGVAGVPKGVANLSRIASRGSGKAAIGEVMKIAGPGIKDALSAGGRIGAGANTLANVMTIQEARASRMSEGEPAVTAMPSTATAVTELRPGAFGRMRGAIPPPTFQGRGAIPPGSYLGPVR